MKKEAQTSKKSLESLKGKKLGDLKSIYAGSLSNELSSDVSMLTTVTIMNAGGVGDDGCDDKG